LEKFNPEVLGYLVTYMTICWPAKAGVGFASASSWPLFWSGTATPKEQIQVRLGLWTTSSSILLYPFSSCHVCLSPLGCQCRSPTDLGNMCWQASRV